MAETELKEQETELQNAIQKLLFEMIPKDENDKKNALLEIRAGTGGDEAALFANDLFNMYWGFAKQHNWRFEIISQSLSAHGGYKEIIVMVQGGDVFSQLRHEAGTHRVQRVPITEQSGRVHTSTATVAIMPEATQVDVEIKTKDIRVDTYRATGAGGQHVNTTDRLTRNNQLSTSFNINICDPSLLSAVRITHIPTGIVVSIQDERCQHKAQVSKYGKEWFNRYISENKAKAMLVLRTRIYEAHRKKLDSERSSMRKSQLGTGDRWERIRTYNYPQHRVIDHRIGKTHFNMPMIMNGFELDFFIGELRTQYKLDKLTAIL